MPAGTVLASAALAPAVLDPMVACTPDLVLLLLLAVPPCRPAGVAFCVWLAAAGVHGAVLSCVAAVVGAVGSVHVACRSLLNAARPMTSTVMAAATASMSCTVAGPAADRVSMRRCATAVMCGKHSLHIRADRAQRRTVFSHNAGLDSCAPTRAWCVQPALIELRRTMPSVAEWGYSSPCETPLTTPQMHCTSLSGREWQLLLKRQMARSTPQVVHGECCHSRLPDSLPRGILR